MRVVRRVVLLVALWLLAWGEVTVANVLTGVAVAGALLVAFPPGRRIGHIRLRPLGALRLGGYVVAQLVASNLVMTREIIRRRPSIHPGVLAHRLQRPSEELVTLMTTVIALSPGTMTVDVDPDSTTIYVHFLLLWDVDASRASLTHLEEVCTRALTITDAPQETR